MKTWKRLLCALSWHSWELIGPWHAACSFCGKEVRR